MVIRSSFNGVSMHRDVAQKDPKEEVVFDVLLVMGSVR